SWSAKEVGPFEEDACLAEVAAEIVQRPRCGQSQLQGFAISQAMRQSLSTYDAFLGLAQLSQSAQTECRARLEDGLRQRIDIRRLERRLDQREHARVIAL